MPTLPLLLRRQPRDPGQAAHRAEPGGNFSHSEETKNRESTVIITPFYCYIPPQLSRRGARPEHVAEVLRAAAAGDSVSKSVKGYILETTPRKRRIPGPPKDRGGAQGGNQGGEAERRGRKVRSSLQNNTRQAD